MEVLEDRSLPSGGPVGYQPWQIAKAYGLDQIPAPAGHARADGTGQTIAILEETRNVRFVGTRHAEFADSDLAHFNRAFGLPDPPSLRIVGFDPKADRAVKRKRVPVDPSHMGEYALDVEWAHAVAPGAKIIVVEFNPDGRLATEKAMRFAASLPGVSVVSHSYGGFEFEGEKELERYFDSPTKTIDPWTGRVSEGHGGVTFFTSSGDEKQGYHTQWPAAARNVVAVGATALELHDDGTWKSEKAWHHSQGGTSPYIPRPEYQVGYNPTKNRQMPDVAAVGAPKTGVATYDSYQNPDGWRPKPVGGTSLSTPIWAGFMAITNQLRAADGLGSLDGARQTLRRLYKLPEGMFHQITEVDDGGQLVPGDPRSTDLDPRYNFFTGRGSPIANLLLPALARGQ